MLQEIAKLTFVDFNRLLSLNTKELIDKVILPQIVYPTGQDVRGWRISDDFMKFMADYAQDLYKHDPETTSILLEIALQRISCGAVLHRPTQVVNILPQEYQKYSTAGDQPGLMTDDCFEFLQKQVDLCYKCEFTREHISIILIGLIAHLDMNTGEEIKGYMLYGSPCFKHTPTEVVDWVWETAETLMPERLYDELAKDDWRKYQDYFRKIWKNYNFDEKHFFKVIGAKHFWQRYKVKKEIFA